MDPRFGKEEVRLGDPPRGSKNKTLTARGRERSLLEPELTLQKALVMAGQIESALEEGKRLHAAHRRPFRM